MPYYTTSIPDKAAVFVLSSVHVSEENSGAEGEVEDGRKFGYFWNPAMFTHLAAAHAGT
jgi:hypothetical protein